MTANLDTTLPTERGLVPGNGSMVAALRAATAAEPLVAGKPAPALMQDALARGQFRSPLVVGDRLDNDIEPAHSVGMPAILLDRYGDYTETPPPARALIHTLADLPGLVERVAG